MRVLERIYRAFPMMKKLLYIRQVEMRVRSNFIKFCEAR
jgi:hypothetical protein